MKLKKSCSSQITQLKKQYLKNLYTTPDGERGGCRGGVHVGGGDGCGGTAAVVPVDGGGVAAEKSDGGYCYHLHHYWYSAVVGGGVGCDER